MLKNGARCKNQADLGENYALFRTPRKLRSKGESLLSTVSSVITTPTLSFSHVTENRVVDLVLSK